jgi:predicted glycoside hydrolase/deacetylase ChbG (UPF0249 family)
MAEARFLCIIADDFGIGPATSRGILELAELGRLSGTVLLVNSPYTEAAVRAWRQAGLRLDLGWHPCLTLDRPIAPAAEVPTLIGPDGNFWPLGRFLTRLHLGRVRTDEIERELRAQYQRFVELVGHPPAVVNTHQHVGLFPPVGWCVRRVLADARARPYLRRVREPWALLARAPGARIKRTVLTVLGRWESRRQVRDGFPGPEWVLGITDPPCVRDPRFFTRWLRLVPGREVELVCHPGHYDESLIGRDCSADDGRLQRRVDELRLLHQPELLDACRQAGLAIVTPSELLARCGEARHAA